MRLFAIGDTHLPSERKKDMDRFGWAEHPAPLQRNWDATVTNDDCIIVAGDISWATRPAEVMDDLAWLDARPGQKVLLRGNHDFWWGDSSSKLKKLFEPFQSFKGFIQNTAVEVGPYLIAGSRLWTAPEAPPMPGGEMGDVVQKPDYIVRETNRLQLSIDDAKAREAKAATPRIRVCAVHFPPLYSNGLPTAFSRTLEAWKPEVCVYGHLHGPGIGAGFVGEHGGVRYVLASCDAAQFKPVLLHG
ncbi:MAG: metallophosphoesterase [Archangium sp.]|nr:metallophosphoesterase [Archangium sp.]